MAEDDRPLSPQEIGLKILAYSGRKEIDGSGPPSEKTLDLEARITTAVDSYGGIGNVNAFLINAGELKPDQGLVWPYQDDDSPL